MGQPIADVLRARRVEVLDADDVLRAALYCDSKSGDLVVLDLFNPKGQGTLMLTVSSYGASAEFWHRGDGVASVSMDAESGAVSLSVGR